MGDTTLLPKGFEETISEAHIWLNNGKLFSKWCNKLYNNGISPVKKPIKADKVRNPNIRRSYCRWYIHKLSMIMSKIIALAAKVSLKVGEHA